MQATGGPEQYYQCWYMYAKNISVSGRSAEFAAFIIEFYISCRNFFLGPTVVHKNPTQPRSLPVCESSEHTLDAVPRFVPIRAIAGTRCTAAVQRGRAGGGRVPSGEGVYR
eukprot:COSAG02_NODE_20210_length_842_cov_5.158816_1_plen_111_part_00